MTAHQVSLAPRSLCLGGVHDPPPLEENHRRAGIGGRDLNDDRGRRRDR